MTGILVDSNVILDLFLDDPSWASWSEQTLDHHSRHGKLYINSVIYTEVSIGFRRIEELDRALAEASFESLAIPKEALFLAGKAFVRYRKQKGTKSSPLPDFYVGAQAAVLGLNLATRDKGRFATYFPTVQLVTP